MAYDKNVDIHAEGVEVKKSFCYFCHANCGVLAYVKDGEVLKITGDPEYPSNQGGLCSRGNIALEHLDHPARINYPLKRAGKKGENKWSRISWDVAISEIAEKLNQIREESGPEAVATAGGTLRTEDWSRRRFMNMFGSPNSFHNALLCWIPTFMVESAVSGWSPFETDLGDSNMLILWGMNPAASLLPGMHGYKTLQDTNRLQIVVIDPRYSETASKADIWMPLKPGSDTELSLAMLHTIIYEGLYDQEFVEGWCEGFEELVAHVKDYTPEWAAERTWLDPELIREVARMYAKSHPANIQWGATLDQLGPNSMAGTHARACMRAICGNLDCPGGDLIPGPAMNYITDEELEANDTLAQEQRDKQIGSDRYRLTSWPGYKLISDITKETYGKAPTGEWMCEAHGPSVFKAILTGDPYPIRALLVSATNPVNSYGDAKMTLEALKTVEFMVTCDYWMTPSALYSDYVMPIAGALERPTIHTNYGVTDSIQCSARAIQPKYERHTDYTFWRDLALATGQEEDQWPWENEEEVFYYVLSPLNLPISDYDDFVEKYRMYYPPMEYYKYGSNGFGFATPSRKVELKSSIMEQVGLPSLPTFVSNNENDIDNPELAKEYPMTLTTGGGHMPFHHSEEYQVEKVRYLDSEPHFRINPIDAKKYRIKDNDWCWIETRRGRIKQRATVDESMHPGAMWAGRGWWYPELGVGDPDNPFGCLTSNVNVLTCVDAETCDPVGGSWNNRGMLCKVYKCKKNEMGIENTGVTSDFSIPGNAKEPGIHIKPSDEPRAYELIPYDPKPTFEVPEGLVWDKASKTAIQPETGYVYDPESGWLFDPETYVYYDVYSGYAFDPEANNLIDMATGYRYDIETRELLNAEGGEQ